MYNFIKIKLREELNIPSAELPSRNDVMPEEIELLKNLQVSDISFNKGKRTNNLIYINVTFDNEKLNKFTSGIKFQIQIIDRTIYQPHIFIADELQRLGLATKIFNSFILKFGHLYFGKGRILNDVVEKIYKKLCDNPNYITFKGRHGILICTKDNPNIEQLKRII